MMHVRVPNVMSMLVLMRVRVFMRVFMRVLVRMFMLVFMRMLMPSHAKKVHLYKDPTPIFTRAASGACCSPSSRRAAACS